MWLVVRDQAWIERESKCTYEFTNGKASSSLRRRESWEDSLLREFVLAKEKEFCVLEFIFGSIVRRENPC